MFQLEFSFKKNLFHDVNADPEKNGTGGERTVRKTVKE